MAEAGRQAALDMPAILMARLEGTRKERLELMAAAERCRWMEGSMISMLSSMGYRVDETGSGYSFTAGGRA